MIMTTLDIRLPGEFVTPEMRAVFDAVRADGGRPMIVGGSVRDAVLGRRSKDTDIEVYGIPDVAHLEYALSALRASVTWTGRTYGVFTVRFGGGITFDVSMPRREEKTGTGHRGFTMEADPAMTFEQAAARRDFTVNAMMADPENGKVLDFHGGLADLNAGILRHTSAAFCEDPLRVLRAVQFAARFGFTLAPETARECCLMCPEYPSLSVERVYGEWAKIATQGVFLSKALTALEDTGWEIWFPELWNMRDVPQEPAWHPEGDVWTHAGLAGDQAAKFADEAGLTGEDRMVVVLAALLHDCGKPGTTRVENARIVSPQHAKHGAEVAKTFLRRSGFPREIIGRIVPLIAEHMNCATRPTKPAVRRMARRLAPANMGELALVIHADASGRGDPDARHGLVDDWLEMSRDLTVSAAPAKGLLTGRHLIAAGLDPGPVFKPILAQAVAAQDDGAFTDEAGAIAWLAERMAIAADAALFPEEPR